MTNLDKYLDPPDEPEAVYCEECGQEMEHHFEYKENWYICKNPFCPAKFEGEAKEMAEKLVNALDTVSRLESRVRFLSNRLRQVDPSWG